MGLKTQLSKEDATYDCISRKAAIDELCDECPRVQSVCPHYPCREYLKIEELPSVQPEIIRCKDCKFAINADTDMMCGNPKSWVVATANDFGCILAERRTDDKTNKSSSC